MAEIVSQTPVKTSAKMITSIRTLSQSPALTSIPSNYSFTTPTNQNDEIVSDTQQQYPIPVIDYALLTSASPEQRSHTIHELGRACRDWGFFMVINHGVPENLINSMIEYCGEFFDLPEEDKQEYQGKHVMDPVRFGTSFNASVETVHFWRDYLKVFVHPVFHSPSKPSGFRECSLEYSRQVREVAREVLKGISESLGLEPDYIDKAMKLDHGLQILAANYYPPCPQPELAMGMPPHSDDGLLTFLIQNCSNGLQIQHDGKWINIRAVPNAFLVNASDHLEILSNGKYKSVLHRAVVNSKATRISIAVANAPSLDTVVSPAEELCDGERAPTYTGMQYKEYLEFQQSNRLDGKTCLYRLRTPTA